MSDVVKTRSKTRALPSWELERLAVSAKGERKQRLGIMLKKRDRSNLKKFRNQPKQWYRANELAEILAVPPSNVEARFGPVVSRSDAERWVREMYELPPAFVCVQEVTDSHAEKFVDRLFQGSRERDVLEKAITASGIMEWPEEPDDHIGFYSTPEQLFYNDAEEEIESRILRKIRFALIRAFKEAATEVLTLRRGHRRTVELAGQAKSDQGV